MAPPSTPPPIPARVRPHDTKRVPMPAAAPRSKVPDINRISIAPASPEVISNLITSLSIISDPANHLFEHGTHSFPNSPFASQTTFDPISSFVRNGAPTARGGGFGMDYGAFNQPTHDITFDDGPLDELPASAPVIKTSKPPSGYSELTAPKPPKQESSSLKSFLRSSRPTSRDTDDSKSIGSVSIEPCPTPAVEVRRKLSSDSWERKQGRSSKGLMYMSSKERLRETERMRASAHSNKSGGLSPLPVPEFDTRSFMSETPITEEPSEVEYSQSALFRDPAPSPGIGPPSPMLLNATNGGIGSGRFIPTRDSSLKAKRRQSTQSRRQSRQSNPDDYMIKEVEETTPPVPTTMHKKRPEHLDLKQERSKVKEALKSPKSPKVRPVKVGSPVTSKHTTTVRVEKPVLLMDEEEGAPAPAISQRKAREKSTDRTKRSGRLTPDPFERMGRRDSKNKRLSGHQSGAESEGEARRKGHSKKQESLDFKTARPSNDGRPGSADSIDDAVDSYLQSPRLSQKIKHPQTGRVISFSEVGDSNGFAVFCCVGMGLTRYITAFYDELALTLKLRLITPDRPGVGDSEPYTDGTATPLSWPDDVYAICQTLKITKFSILAHSAGAIYALATALRMPQHIRGRIHLLAPWIPPSQLNVVGGQAVLPPANSIPTGQRVLRALPTSMLKIANSSFMSATSSSITSSLPKQRRNKRKSTGKDTPSLSQKGDLPVGDKENVTPGDVNDYLKQSGNGVNSTNVKGNGVSSSQKKINDQNAILAAAALTAAQKERQVAYDTRLTHAIWDLATSGANPAVDLLICLERRHTIGFRYVDITRPVVIHHGSKDTRVPVDNVRWLGKMMRRCEVRILEGEGHGLMASAQVMGGVLMEVAGEWEDWTRVVERKGTKEGERRLREARSVGAFRG